MINILKKSTHYEIVAIGASVGGPMALKTILSRLPVDFPLPIVIVQHMSQGFIKGFSQWLASNIVLEVKNVTNGEVLERGTVYIAPERHHFGVVRVQRKLVGYLIDEESGSGFCPSIDKMLQSVAQIVGKQAIGILLTGMSDDGANGLLALKKAQGHTLIQDAESSIVFGMGAVAQSLHAVDKVIELEHMADYLMEVCSGKP